MLSEIKKELLNKPEKIEELLEYFDYCNIVVRPKYIQFGRDEHSSKKSIVIKLVNNDNLYVHDYARNISKDIFSYIIDQRKVEFTDVLKAIKICLGISDYYTFFNKKGIFGGFYERIRKRRTNTVNIYDDSVLDCYSKCGNVRFLKDHISLKAQKYFNIRYDSESQAIVIPIYNQLGQLMGVKERVNYEIEDGDLKYFYTLPCYMTSTLYGYSHNYSYLTNNTILIFESEKSVLQCFSYGIRNCVALGSGSISTKQIQMMLELNPKRIVFMHDVGFKKEYLDRNINMFRNYSRFSETEIGFWDWEGKPYEDKVSASDMGKETLQYILKNEIKMIGSEEAEEEL